MMSDWLTPKLLAATTIASAAVGVSLKVTDLRRSVPLVGLPFGLLVCPFIAIL